MAMKRNRKFRIKRTNRSPQKLPSKKLLCKIRTRPRILGRRKIKIRREGVPTTARQYFSRSKQFQEDWDSVGQVVSKMRSGPLRFSEASKEIGIDPDKV